MINYWFVIFQRSALAGGIRFDPTSPRPSFSSLLSPSGLRIDTRQASTMARFTVFLGAVLLGLAGIAVGVPSGSLSASGAIARPTSPKPLFRSFGLGRDNVRIDDRLERRDCEYT